MDGPCERQAPRRPASGLETLDASPKQVTNNDRARSDGRKNKTGIGVPLRYQSLWRLAIQIRLIVPEGASGCAVAFVRSDGLAPEPPAGRARYWPGLALYRGASPSVLAVACLERGASVRRLRSWACPPHSLCPAQLDLDDV